MARAARNAPHAPLFAATGLSTERAAGEHRSLLHDPYDLNSMQEFLEAVNGRTRFGLYALEQMAHNPWAAAIINTRQNQVGEMAYPQTDPFGMGFVMGLRHQRKDGPNTTEEREANRLSDWLQTCGEYRNEGEQFSRDSFETFLRKLTWDSMVFDGYAYEVCKDRTGKPGSFLAVDAKTIWRCVPSDAYGDRALEEAAFLQRVQEQTVAYFPADEMAFGIRRPRTDMKQNGYGYPELAEMVTAISGLLFGWTYNINYFKNGGPRGVVSLKGQVPEKQFRAFQRQMLFAASGIRNAFRMAIVNPSGPDAGVEWVPFGQPNREMEFSEWINACFRLACAVWQIDPSEVGFYFQTSGGADRAPLFQTNPEAKLQAGRDKGLRPLLRNLAGSINRYLIWPQNPDFELRFVGQDAMSEKERADLDAALMKTRRWNEVRALRRLPPIEGPEGDFVDSMTWFQYRQYCDANAKGAEGQDGAPAGPGGPTAPAGGEPDDGGDWPAWMDNSGTPADEGAPKAGPKAAPAAGPAGEGGRPAAGGAEAGNAPPKGPGGGGMAKSLTHTEPRPARRLTIEV